jgi:hypothetical protein
VAVTRRSAAGSSNAATARSAAFPPGLERRSAVAYRGVMSTPILEVVLSIEIPGLGKHVKMSDDMRIGFNADALGDVVRIARLRTASPRTEEKVWIVPMSKVDYLLLAAS